MMLIRKIGNFSAIATKANSACKKGKESGLLRYPPTTACPWTTDRVYDWVPVEGKGTVHSYAEVHHAIQPAFKGHTPYMMLLVDLNTQKGAPTEHEALRVAGNLLTADGEFAPPEMIKSVGIGTRVRMVFKHVTDGFSLPHWVIDETAEQPNEPWRYPQE
jgi:uncharacterized OB-fold protein